MSVTEDGHPFSYLLDVFEGDELAEHDCPHCAVAGAVLVKQEGRPVAIYCSWCRSTTEVNDRGWPEDLT